MTGNYNVSASTSTEKHQVYLQLSDQTPQERLWKVLVLSYWRGFPQIQLMVY